MNLEEKTKLYMEIKRSLYVNMITDILGDKKYEDLKPLESFKFQSVLVQYNRLFNKFQS